MAEPMDSSPAQDSVDITIDNFEAMLPAVAHAVEGATFLAFDCEMTGLFLDTNKHAQLDDMAARYDKVRVSAESFVINQFGLAAFAPAAGGGGGWEARTFNFNLFPRTFWPVEKVFTCEAGSLEYLAQHNFDFNKMVYKGIPFMPLATQDRLLRDVDKPESFPQRKPNTPEDKAVVRAAQESVQEWYRGGEPTVVIAEGLSAFHRSLVYTMLRGLRLGGGGWRGFYFEKSGEWASQGILLTRATEAESAARDVAVREEKIRAIKAACGFARFMTTLRGAGKPVVGHNCFFDVVYILAQFVRPCATWRDLQRAAAEYFPAGLYDTKYLSRVLEGRHEGLLPNTSLGAMYEHLRQTDAELPHARLLADAAARAGGGWAPPEVTHAEGFTRYAGAAGAEYAHEAGFDAFMTGACFAQLLPLVAASQALQSGDRAASPPRRAKHEASMVPDAAAVDDAFAAVAPFNGRINLMRTDMPHCDLYGDAPALQRPFTYVVAAVDDPSALPSVGDVRGALMDVAVATPRARSLRVENLWGTRRVAGVAVTLPFRPDGAEMPQWMPHAIDALAKHDALAGCRVMQWHAYAAIKARHEAEAADGVAADAAPSRTSSTLSALSSSCVVM